MPTARYPLYNMSGLGNAIVVADLRARPAVLNADQVRAIAADPRTPFDQLMVLHAPSKADIAARVSIFNADGSRSGACGNGMRCIGLIAGTSDHGNLLFETDSGTLAVSFPTPDIISVDMGEPRFGWRDVPLRHAVEDTTAIDLLAGPLDRPVLARPSVCSMGNPHAVFWVVDVDQVDLESYGAQLETHEIFPERANISVAQVIAEDHARIRTWERGVGITGACGSAACAVLACGVRTSRLARSATIAVPGGDLQVHWTAANSVIMSGPAELVSQGELILTEDGRVGIEI
ncbi:MAG: diaminopimelate epimerase [Hyphomicrobiaceae bacterium]